MHPVADIEQDGHDGKDDQRSFVDPSDSCFEMPALGVPDGRAVR